MGDAARLLQNFHEGGAVHRVMAKGAVHHIAAGIQRAQGAGGKAGQPLMLLIHEKSLKNRMRVALVKVVADDFNGASLLAKALVQTYQLVRAGVQALFNAHAHNLAQLGHCFGRPVIVAHQRLTCAHGQFAAFRRGGAVAKGLSHGGLQVKHQAVFMPPRCGVQAGANQAEQ